MQITDVRLFTLLVSSLAIFAPISVLAQDRSLEGTTVTLKIDMPASSDGVSVHPGAAMPVDFRKISDGLHQYGVGVHKGESIMVTKVILKKDHVEVHLGGGGFGTFADRLAVASAESPAVPYEGKSRREKDLENQLKYSNDSSERKEARKELDDLHRERSRDTARDAALNAQTRQMAESNFRQQRAAAGSRFNIRYDGGLPPDAATRNGIMKALNQYVDFEEAEQSSQPPPAAASSTASGREPQGFSPGLRKGLTVVQVEQFLGPAAKVNQKNEGSLEMSIREYATADGQQVPTTFVGGVLVDYKITPR